MSKSTRATTWGILLFALLVLTLSSPLIHALPNEISLQGKLTNSSGGSAVGTFNISFKLYDSFSAGSILYQSTQNITTDSNGVYDTILRNINLNFDIPYYLGITIGTDAEATPRINLTSSPYSFRSNVSESLNPINAYTISNLTVLGNITLGTPLSTLQVTSQGFNVSRDGNLIISNNATVGQKLTLRFGQLIENFASGMVRITGNLFLSGSINATELNATSISASGSLQVRGQDVQVESAAFKASNFTSAYDSRADRFSNANFTSLYNAGEAAAFRNSNATALLDNVTIIRTSNTTWWQTVYDSITTRFGNANFTALYDARTDRFGNANATALLDNNSIVRAANLSTVVRTSDAFNSANFTTQYESKAYYKEENLSADLAANEAPTIVTTTLTSDTIIVNKNLYVIGNISNTNVANLNINGSLFPALDNIFDLGNGTLRWRNANLSGTLQAGTLSASTITGSTINGQAVQVNGAAVQVEGTAFKNENFTARYDSRNDRFGLVNYTALEDAAFRNVNFTTQYDARSDRFGATNYSSEYASTGFKAANFTSNFATHNQTSGVWNTTSESVFLRDQSKKVGIGTDSPLSTVHINGSGPSGGLRITNESTDTTILLVNSSSGRLTLGSGQFLGPNGALLAPTYSFSGSTTSGFFSSGSDVRISSGGTLAAVFSSTGILASKTGINLTSTGSQTFTVLGTFNVTAQNTRGSDLFVSTSGNVGIGTSSPAEKLVVIGKVNISDSLNVSGTVQAARFIGDGSGLSGVSNTIFTYSNVTDYLGGAGSNTSLIRADNLSSVVRTTDAFNGGNFSSNLASVNGSIALWNSTSTAVFLRDQSKNVGIGTTTPTEKLTVLGNVSISSNLSVRGEISAVSYDIGWTNLSNYPSACPVGEFVTQIGDTLTCASPSETSSAAGGWANDSANTRSSLNVIVDTDLLVVNASSNKVGINTGAPQEALEIIGNTIVTGKLNASVINASDSLQIRGQDVQVESSSFKISNFTTSINTYIPSFFTALNLSRFFGFSSESAANASIITRTNTSWIITTIDTQYPSLDTSRTDDFTASNLSPLLDNNTLVRASNTTFVTSQSVGGTEVSGTVGAISINAALTRDVELDNNTIVRAGNSSFVTSQAVGGEVSGTVGSVTIGPLIQRVASAFNAGNFTSLLTGFFGYSSISEANASIITKTNTSWITSTISSTYPNLDTDSTNDLTLAQLDNNSIVRASNLSTVVRTADAFNAANFSTAYDARTDRFGIANYTALENAAFRNENFTTQYESKAYYKEENLSADLAANEAPTIVTTTLTSDTIIVNKNLYVIGNISNTNVANLNINGSLFPALDNIFDLGNGTLRWRNANLSGTLQAGTLSASTITGATINGQAVQVNGAAVQVEGSAFKNANFTSFATTNGYLSTSNATAIGILIQNSTINRSIDLSTYAKTSELSTYQVEANAFKTSNYSAEYASTGFKAANFTSNFATHNSTSGLWNTTSSTVFLRDQSKNVGVGTIDPQASLHINGSGSSGGLLVTNDSGTVALFVNSSTGNVAIGSKNTSASLRVHRGQVLVPAGSVTAPSLAFTTQPGVGWWSSGSRDIRLADGGFSPFRISSGQTIFTTGSEDMSAVGLVNILALNANNSLTLGVGSGANNPAHVMSIDFRKNYQGFISPTAISGANNLGVIKSYGYVGSTNGYKQATEILFTSEGSISDTNGGRIGGNIIFSIAPDIVGGNLTEVMRVNSQQKVGINATSPSQTLTIGGTFNVTTASQGSNPSLFVNSVGNVGIGTPTPAEKLHVIGNINTTGSINISGTVQAARFVGDGSGLTGFTFTNFGNANYTALEDAAFRNTNFTTLYDARTDRFGVTNYTALENAAFQNANFTSNFVTHNQTSAVWNSTSNAIFLKDQSKNVGIGTSSPGTALHVIGSVNVSSFIQASSLNISGPANLAHESGNVGIGTKEPSTKLHITQSSSSTSILNGPLMIQNVDSTASNTVGIAFTGIQTPSGTLRYYAGIDTIMTDHTSGSTKGNLVFSTDDNSVRERMRITYDGKVGIGQSIPNVSLGVSGSANITSILYAGSINTSGTVQAARFVGDGSLLTGLIAGTTFNRENVTDYLGGTGANDSLIRSTNTTFFGLFSKVSDAFSLVNLTNYFGDASFNASVIRSTNTSWFNTNFNAQLASANASISQWNATGTAIFARDIGKNVGIGTATPSKALVVNSTSTANAITLDPSASTPLINTTGNNLTLTSATGSVIIKLG